MFITLLDLPPEPPLGISVGELLAIGGILCAMFVPLFVVVAAVLHTKRRQKTTGS